MPAIAAVPGDGGPPNPKEKGTAIDTATQEMAKTGSELQKHRVRTGLLPLYRNMGAVPRPDAAAAARFR
ncbi:hypothetical protein GCM10010187_70150 [Actinomadura coerulea]|nr:hypothetical protein GCM10010187_70150 [Actinomadura coerulea]